MYDEETKEVFFMHVISSPEVIAAIIAVSGVALTAVVSVLTVKKEIYAKSVIEQRTKWLTTFRTKLGVFMSAWEVKRSSENNSCEPNFDRNRYNDLIIKGEEARYYLISTLNTKTLEGNEYNAFLKKCLKEMNLIKEIGKGSKLFEDEYTQKFMEAANRMLHQVWDKAKKEAGR